MPLRILIYCGVHDDAPVEPAGDQYHFLPTIEKLQHGTHENVVYELDAADLYCTGGTGDHQFIASVFSDTKENFAGQHVDGLGIDIIA